MSLGSYGFGRRFGWVEDRFGAMGFLPVPGRTGSGYGWHPMHAQRGLMRRTPWTASISVSSASTFWAGRRETLMVATAA